MKNPINQSSILPWKQWSLLWTNSYDFYDKATYALLTTIFTGSSLMNVVHRLPTLEAVKPGISSPSNVKTAPWTLGWLVEACLRTGSMDWKWEAAKNAWAASTGWSSASGFSDLKKFFLGGAIPLGSKLHCLIISGGMDPHKCNAMSKACRKIVF